MSVDRILRVNQLVKKELSRLILKEMEFPTGVLVTVTRVETSRDLRDSNIHVSVMPEKNFEKSFEFLNKKTYELQGGLNKILKMRPLPRIKFLKEKETSEAGRIEEILARLKKEEK